MTRITVESWDPEYGAPLGIVDLESTEAAIDAAPELAPDRWQPLSPSPDLLPASSVAFVDGVRRIDALVWIESRDGMLHRGICASYAAGVVRAAERATVDGIQVRRGLFSTAPASGIPTHAGHYEPMAVAEHEIDQLSLALQARLRELEVEVSVALESTAELVVVDGPLWGRPNVAGTIGYVKTHRVAYLPDELGRVVARLDAGQRTPLFVMATGSWTRYSWYLRLPGPAGHPWAGIVRLEAGADREVADARRLADLSTVTLPVYASVAHKEPRAPQNLFPIAGLERELRHRLGDASLVHRALREAAAAADR